jgi:hypothetical protein
MICFVKSRTLTVAGFHVNNANEQDTVARKLQSDKVSALLFEAGDDCER